MSDSGAAVGAVFAALALAVAVLALAVSVAPEALAFLTALIAG